MIPTKCVVCSKSCLLPETEMELRDPVTTKYWSYNEDGSRRPYCGVECGLKEYEERRKQ